MTTAADLRALADEVEKLKGADRAISDRYDPTTKPYDEPLRHINRRARFINCEVCQTEGRILRNSGGPDDVDYGICPACHGKREVEVECEPITIWDLENAEWY